LVGKLPGVVAELAGAGRLGQLLYWPYSLFE
jgi:hypothetical protein